jgi:hypothetical protein
MAAVTKDITSGLTHEIFEYRIRLSHMVANDSVINSYFVVGPIVELPGGFNELRQEGDKAIFLLAFKGSESADPMNPTETDILRHRYVFLDYNSFFVLRGLDRITTDKVNEDLYTKVGAANYIVGNYVDW